MRAGITIQHSREIIQSDDVVRSNVAGFIGVIPSERWPRGIGRGDYVEIQAQSLGEVSSHPAVRLIDRATLTSVRQFFENGGESVCIYGLCIETEQDLLEKDPFGVVFSSLIDRLRAEEHIGILLMPILAYMPVNVTPSGVEVQCEAVYEMLLEHCWEMNNRFLILDAPKDLHERGLFQWVQEFRERNRATSSYGAIYYPWLANGDAVFPPSGCVAGVFAAVESEDPGFGVRTPPANRVLTGVTHPEVAIPWATTDQYITAHINPILTQPARGVVIWGARTLSMDERWMHINSRRILSLVAEQLRRDNEWVIFENIRPDLYEIVRRTVQNRLDDMWAGGLLTGDQAGLEYTVQCDEELNPPAVRDVGQVNVRVMVRPISTAEFIVVDLRLGR